jgi:hypothetical protein
LASHNRVQFCFVLGKNLYLFRSRGEVGGTRRPEKNSHGKKLYCRNAVVEQNSNCNCNCSRSQYAELYSNGRAIQGAKRYLMHSPRRNWSPQRKTTPNPRKQYFHPIIISSPQIHVGRGVHGGVTFRGVERHPTTSVEPPKSPDLHLSLDALGRPVHRIPRSSPWIRRPMSPVAQSPVSQSPKVPERPDGQGTAKRRRTRGPRPPSHHACVACKARKVRCDAVRPTCSYCTARNIDCVYPPTFKRASCSEAYVASPLSPTDRLLLLHFSQSCCFLGEPTV